MDTMDRFGLSLLGSGYYLDYDAECSATIRNEFAAAVFRLGHTLLKVKFWRDFFKFEILPFIFFHFY